MKGLYSEREELEAGDPWACVNEVVRPVCRNSASRYVFLLGQCNTSTTHPENVGPVLLELVWPCYLLAIFECRSRKAGRWKEHC